jgi:glutathione S-transferase
MKLYHVDLSPFAARCRILIYAKNLDVELADPPGGLGSEEYKNKVNPNGKVPALDVGGWILPESETICEYLEDRFPEPPMRPADAEYRARMRLISRFADLYVVPPLQVLFGQVDPSTRDAELVRAQLETLRPRFDQLDALLAPGPYAVGDRLTLADCALAPLFFFATRLLPLLGDKDPTADRARLTTWWEAVQRHDAVAKVSGELARALAERFGRS